MANPDFRHDARQALARAQAELETGDDSRLKYACLELRMSMEALTYDRAAAFKEEFPEGEYETWQPKKVLQVLLEIDPYADKDSVIAVGLEETPGVPAKEMQSLGQEKVLNMSTLKKHYDAMGSYLHIPTLGQIKSGKTAAPARVRSRCGEIATFLQAVLSSPVFNANFKVSSEIECVECGATIRKRLPRDGNVTEAACGGDCDASYTLHIDGDQVRWEPQYIKVPCADSACGHKINVWPRELVAGRGWTCPECQKRNEFALGVRLVFDETKP